jgi:hypothetical protein
VRLVEFTTGQVAVVSEDGSETVALGTEDEYLLLSRPDDPGNDWGVYVEYADELDSAYDCVESCSLRGDVLEIELSKPLGPRSEIMAFRIVISLSGSDRSMLEDGLQAVFRGRERALDIGD